MSSTDILGAPVDVDIRVNDGARDAHYHIFQQANFFRGATMTVGNFFLGLQGNMVAKLVGHGIPRQAKIDSCVLELTPSASSGAAITVQVSPLRHDANQVQTRWKRNDPPADGPRWASDFWGTFDALVRDGGGGTIADITPLATNSAWALNSEDRHGREALASKFTLASAATVADVQLELYRANSPTGDVDVSIQGNALSFGISAPDGVNYLQGTTDAATLPTATGVITTVPLGTGGVLQPGVYWVVVSRSQPVDAVNLVLWRQRRVFFNSPPSAHLARGTDFGYGNYPGAVDVASSFVSGDSVDWTTASVTQNVAVQTPDLSAALQKVVDAPAYHDGDPLAWAITAVGQAAQRRFWAYDAFPVLACRLLATYRPRIVSSGGRGLRNDEEEAIAMAAVLLLED